MDVRPDDCISIRMRFTRKAFVMKKVLAALAAAATIGLSVTVASTPAQARCAGCAFGAGVATGVIGSAIIAGAAAQAAPRPYYAPTYVTGPGPGCYYTRQRVWDGYFGVWRRGPRTLVCP
jgi:hypothetical protein